MSNIPVIIQREFNERVRKKSFIITTILMPVLMVALTMAPALLMLYAGSEQKRIAVIDRSGLVLPHLENDEELLFEPTDLNPEEARQQLTEHFGVLCIGPDVMSGTPDVRLYANSSISFSLESAITDQIKHIIETEKLRSYNIDNLQQILDEVETNVTVKLFRNDKSQEEDAQASSSVVATAISYILSFVLYMFLLLYGSMIMQSVIEEKNNRVLEVIVASVRPFDLMMGKILGVAAVALTQLLIWCVVLFATSTLLLPHLLPEEILAGAQAMQQGASDATAIASGIDSDMLLAVGTLTDTGYIARIVGCLALFLFGGYLLYASMFAAVGSAVDNIQDASQLQMPITLPIIFALMMMIAVIKDPNSPLAFWCSIIPLTSPVVMMARIPYDIPTWEIVLSLVVLYASFVFMVMAAGRIYRVGIFMYGKKPTFKELLKWMRYK